MNNKSKMKLLGVSIAATAVFGGAIVATADQREQQKVTPKVQVSRKTTAAKAATEDLIRTVLVNGEWVCRQKKKNGGLKKAFKLKLSPNKLEAVTPSGPILPIEGNPATFDGAMASGDSDIYSKFGFWEVSADVIILKWYAKWDEDPTSARAMARALAGANRYPGEIQVDVAIIDNLERGISVLGVKSDAFMDESFEIKVERIEPAYLSGKITTIRPPRPSASGIRAYEYEPLSGSIRTIRPTDTTETGFHPYKYEPIRCDRAVAAPVTG